MVIKPTNFKDILTMPKRLLDCRDACHCAYSVSRNHFVASPSSFTKAVSPFLERDIYLSYFAVVVSLDGIQADDSKESVVLVVQEGLMIAKNISTRMKIAVDNGNLTLSINGTSFIPDKQSFDISEPKPYCAKGQTLRDNKYCCKFFIFFFKAVNNSCDSDVYIHYVSRDI